MHAILRIKQCIIASKASLLVVQMKPPICIYIYVFIQRLCKPFGPQVALRYVQT